MRNRSTVIQNAVEINGHILHSTHVHDWVSYTDEKGNQWYIDGGTEYLHTNIMGSNDGHNDLKIKWLTLSYEDSSLKDIVENLLWGTYGKGTVEEYKKEADKLIDKFVKVNEADPKTKQAKLNKDDKLKKLADEGKEMKEEINSKLKWVRLYDCETDHLEAILRTCPNIPPLHTCVIKLILDDRKKVY